MWWIILTVSSVFAIGLTVYYGLEEMNVTCRICPECGKAWYSSDIQEDWICQDCDTIITPEEDVHNAS